MSPRDWKIDFAHHQDTPPRPPFRVFAPSLFDSFVVKAKLHDLKQALTGNSVYPPDLVEPKTGLRLDALIFQAFRPYFQALADCLGITIDLDEFDAVSRHEFFVCTEAITHWQNPDELMPGLSHIEAMLGYSYAEPTSTVASAPPPYIPSGDYEAYLIAALALNFPHAGMEMARLWDVDFLSKILKDAAYLSKPEKDRESLPTPETAHVMDARFEEQRGAIAGQLEELGVTIPTGF